MILIKEVENLTKNLDSYTELSYYCLAVAACNLLGGSGGRVRRYFLFEMLHID